MAVLTVIFFLCLFTWFTSPDKATSKDIVQNAQKIILYVFGLLFKQGSIIIFDFIVIIDN